MRADPDEKQNDLSDLLEPLQPPHEWACMGVQFGIWPFSWHLSAERVYPLPWHIYALEIGPFQFTINLGRWPHAD